MGSTGVGRDFGRWWGGVTSAVLGLTAPPLHVAQHNTLRSVLVQFEARHRAELTPARKQTPDRAIATFAKRSEGASFGWTTRIARGVNGPLFPGDAQPWAKTAKVTHLQTSPRLAGRPCQSQRSVRGLASDVNRAVRRYCSKP